MNKKTITKGLVAALAATTFMAGFASATDASAQSRRGWSGGRGGYSHGYYGHRNNTGRNLAIGAAIGAAVAGGAYYGGYGRGYYGGRNYAYGYGPGYGYYGAPGYYGYGGGYAATCVRRVWDPYIGRWVRVRSWC